MEELSNKYLAICSIRENLKTSLKSYIKDSIQKHGNRFVLKPLNYGNWDDAIEQEGSFITNEIPFCVTLQNCSGDTFEVYLTSVKLCLDDFMAYVTGYNMDSYDYGWVEDYKCYMTLSNMMAIADFINLSLGNKHGWVKVGSKCRWIDPGINDYDEQDREMMLNRVFEVVGIEGDIVSIESEHSFAEVYACELEPIV